MSQLGLFNADKKEFEKIYLDEYYHIEIHYQVPLFKLNPTDFEQLWNEHPEEFHNIIINGKEVKIPRWQQAYGKSNEYTGSKNNALPLQEHHQKYIDWCNEQIDPKLNGLLINWYDGKSKHYIGKHRDSTIDLVPGSPIITISHGETRVFRFRPFRGEGFKDFLVNHGDVLVIPWDTNKKFTHEVPHFKKYQDRRISVTLRAFE